MQLQIKNELAEMYRFAKPFYSEIICHKMAIYNATLVWAALLCRMKITVMTIIRKITFVYTSVTLNWKKSGFPRRQFFDCLLPLNLFLSLCFYFDVPLSVGSFGIFVSAFTRVRCPGKPTAYQQFCAVAVFDLALQLQQYWY